MTYTKTIWLDQVVQKPRTYQLVTNPDSTITLIDSFGTVTELGTPVNAANLNKIEDKLFELDGRTVDLSGLANTNLSNITASGKNTSIQWDRPDWANVVNKSWATTYTADKSGWVYVRANMSTGINPIFKINNINVWEFAFDSAYNINVCGFFPIEKDNTYRAEGGNGAQILKFYPCKGGS